ncbi:MAG: class I SAM-dependent methyltransferase [Methylobacter sp.]|nr:class I SAM-dependent methyltransferase [Methylobacter sp.]
MQLYNEKKPDYFSSSRSQIIDLLPDFSQRVLEIGCGSGQTLETLKKMQACAETVGVELFEAAADSARNRVDTVYCLDVEKNPLPAHIGKFNLILLLDVLEHLVDPWTLLKRLKEEHLAVDGKIIISLPNARHFSLVLPLLVGRFDYVERGILDKTHLRFFTKDSATKLLKSAGLNIEAIKPASLDIRLNSGKLNVITLGLFSGFIASQYLFKATAENKI